MGGGAVRSAHASSNLRSPLVSQWQSDYCNASGQAAYNLPLSVGCSSDATTYFTCQGPISDK